MYEELVKSLRVCGRMTSIDDNCISYVNGCCEAFPDCAYALMDQAANVIEELNMELINAKEFSDYADAVRELKPKWIPVTEKLPKCEQEVMICTEKKLVGKDAYIDSIVTPAIYEDGTMPECDSIWHWEDIDYAGWDEENDCGIIPEGWWENRHFNPDEVYNNPVDRKVVAWMPLPKPPEDGAE